LINLIDAGYRLPSFLLYELVTFTDRPRSFFGRGKIWPCRLEKIISERPNLFRTRGGTQSTASWFA